MAGVPHGSSPGPLIFLVYINDLAEVVKCNLKMFADDACLYVTVEDPTTSDTSLNEDFTNVQQWADQWLVNWNPSKTKSMLFSNKNNTHLPLIFQDRPKDEIEQHKHLGMGLYSTLL